MSKQDEFRLSCVVADWLERALPSRAIWTHFPAGENRNAATGARLKRMGTARGWPDYLIILDRRVFGIELKARTGKVSDAQAYIGERFHDNGCPWTVARSLDEVESFLRQYDVPLKATVLARAA